MMWVRLYGSTPKSYKWVCSVCGEVAYNVPGDKPPGRYCPHCGEYGEYGVYESVLPKKLLATDETRFMFGRIKDQDDNEMDALHCVKCGYAVAVEQYTEVKEFGFVYCPRCGRLIRDENDSPNGAENA